MPYYPECGESIEVVQKIADEPIVPPTEVEPTLPNELDDVLLDALVKKSGQRYKGLLYLRDSLHTLSEGV